MPDLPEQGTGAARMDSGLGDKGSNLNVGELADLPDRDH